MPILEKRKVSVSTWRKREQIKSEVLKKEKITKDQSWNENLVILED